MYKYFLIFILLLSSLSLQAGSVTPLPLGYGALLYDINFPSGPGSHGTIDAGQWVSDITAFNSGAQAKNSITRLYPYSSDIEITCTDPSNIGTCSILPGYASGNASVAAYYSAFPSAAILPIVDIADNYLNNNLLKTNISLADSVAQDLATQLCNDPKVAGVFLDLEMKGGLSNPGLVEFYRQLSKLLASSICVDSTHPNGRYMGIYLTPVGDDWSIAQSMFVASNGYIAIPLYDVLGFTNPPTPNPINGTKGYSGYVTSALQHARAFSEQFKVPYSIIVPAGASFGTFQEYGIYNSSEPAPTYFQLITNYSTSNATQLLYVQTARNIACKQQSAYFMGMDYWSWNQYVSPGRNKDGTYQLVMPNIPDTDTVSYLQANASC